MTDTADNSPKPPPEAERAPIIRVFGAMGVEGGDGLVSIGGPKQRRLLALLAVRAGSTVTLDWLEEHLWDDEERPEPTTPTLRTYVSRLRNSFPTEAQNWIETEPAGYRFTAPDEAVEHRRFAMLRAEANRARGLDDPQTAQNLLDEALAMWRGQPFRELEDLDWARADIEQLQMDRLEMMEERWEVVLALGRHTQITGELAAFTAEHGLRDRAARQSALALHRSGRTTEALRVIEEHRRTLAEQGGLEPSPDIVELGQAILSGDPALIVEKTGRPLRGYRLIEQIGSGAFSVVWRGIQPSVNRDVAIKQIRSELASQADFIRRFEAEAQLVARIEHPHIVPMIDFWRDPDSAYLVMRWLRGGTLERRLDAGPMTVDATMLLARQIGGALSAAHARGVVHRDVKPANILFDEDGHGFLTDFGIALDVVDSGGPEAALSQGSPAYASPEQIRREALGPRADIFSLGVVIYECLAGSLPFRDSTSLQDLVERQLHVPYPLLSEWRTDLPVSMIDAVAKATSKDPAKRFGSVAEFLEAFERAADVAPSEGGGATREGGPIGVGVDSLGRNPYKGLQAFTEADAVDFHGRERLVDRLLEVLGRDGSNGRIAAVVGPSGIGKSSVVRAGLLPALRSGGAKGSDKWFVATMLPSHDPFEELGTALLRVAMHVPENMMGLLSADDRGIARVVKALISEDSDAQVLLVIDQFEELFTLADESLRRRFLRAIEYAVSDLRCPLRVVFTIRADFWDRPLRHGSFARLIAHSTVNVTALAADELERAIVDPAASVGCEFEPGLVSEIVADVTDEPGALPLLQYALTELWEKRTSPTLTRDAYRELGGVAGALARRAEELHSESTEEEQQALRRVFGRLVTLGEGNEDSRRRVLRGELGEATAASAVIDRFGAARLLSFDRDPASREPTVEVAHEALIGEWPRLRGWLEEDRDGLRVLRHLTEATAAWDAAGRDQGDLYRGGRLEAAEEWATGNRSELNESEAAFLDAAVAARVAREAEEEARFDQQLRSNRRLKQLLIGTGVFLAVALIAGTVAFQQRGRAQDNQALAEQRTDEALAAEEGEKIARANSETRRLEATARELASAALANLTADPQRSVLLALEAVDTTRSVDGTVVPEAEEALYQAVQASRLIFALDAGPGVAFSPDGSLLATTMADNSVRLWDPTTGELAGELEGAGAPEGVGSWPLIDVAFSDDGMRVAAVAALINRPVGGYAITAWDVATEAALSVAFGHSNNVTSVSLSPDGSLLATSSLDSSVRLWDVDTAEAIGVFEHVEPALSASFSPDGSLLVVASGANVHVWDVASRTKQLELEGHEATVMSVRFLPDAERVVSASLDGTARIWDLDQEATVGFLRHSSAVRVATPNKSGTMIATGTEDGLVTLWDVALETEILSLAGHTSPVNSLSFSADSTLLASGAGLESISPRGQLTGQAQNSITNDELSMLETRVWDVGVSYRRQPLTVPARDSTTSEAELAEAGLRSGRVLTPEGGTRRFADVALSPDGTQMAVSGLSGQMTLWDTNTGRKIATINGHEMPVTGIAYSPSGEQLVTAAADGVRTWDAATGALLLNLIENDIPLRLEFGWYIDVEFSPDGETVAVSRSNMTLTLVDATSAEIVDVRTLTGSPNGIKYRPDGTTIAAGSDRTAALIITQSGEAPALLHEELVDDVAYSPDGTQLATVSRDGRATMWDLTSDEIGGTIIYLITAERLTFRTIAFSPTGESFATGGDDGTIRIWDATDGSSQLTLQAHDGPVLELAYGPDGTRLASVSTDGTAKLNILDIDETIALAQSRSTRSFTTAECRQYLHKASCDPT